MKKEYSKQRCQYSKEGLETFGKQRRGYVVGESKSGGWRLFWDGLKTPSVYAKDFIEINPLIDLYIDDNGVEKEKPIKEEGTEITPDIILRIESALEKLRKTGISERGIEVLVKDYCGAKVNLTEIREVLRGIDKLKSFYFKSQTPTL